MTTDLSKKQLTMRVPFDSEARCRVSCIITASDTKVKPGILNSKDFMSFYCIILHFLQIVGKNIFIVVAYH